MDVGGQLLTSPEVAALIKRSPRTVHRLVAGGELTPAQRLNGPNGAFLFDRAAVDDWLKRQSSCAA